MNHFNPRWKLIINFKTAQDQRTKSFFPSLSLSLHKLYWKIQAETLQKYTVNWFLGCWITKVWNNIIVFPKNYLQCSKYLLNLKKVNYSLYRFIQHFLLITQIKDKVNEYRKVNHIQQTGSVFPGYSVICSGLYNWGRDYHYHRELYINCSLQNRKALLIYVVILLKCQFKLLKTLRSILFDEI